VVSIAFLLWCVLCVGGGIAIAKRRQESTLVGGIAGFAVALASEAALVVIAVYGMSR
jgi:hypothetical protein